MNGEALAICKKLGSEAKTVAEAETDEKISQHIQKGIDAYNKQAASRAQMVQKWKILRKDFTVAGGELGKTLFFFFYGLHKVCFQLSYFIISLFGLCWQ